MWLNKINSIQIRLAFAGLFFIILQGCNIGKQLPTEKKIYITDEAGYEAIITSSVPKYIFNVSEEQIRTAFLRDMKLSMGYNKLIAVDDLSQADFKLVIRSIKIIESETSYTVSDADSPYNGMTFPLANCEIRTKADLYLYSGGKETLLESIEDIEDKEEKVKNSRTLGDLITGDNKDNNQYRLKAFPDNVFEDVAEKGGRSMAAKVTNKLVRRFKKGEL